jgi:hypothetical protein
VLKKLSIYAEWWWRVDLFPSRHRRNLAERLTALAKESVTDKLPRKKYNPLLAVKVRNIQVKGNKPPTSIVL